MARVLFRLAWLACSSPPVELFICLASTLVLKNRWQKYHFINKNLKCIVEKIVSSS